MPYINVQITKGATRDQKAEIVRAFTDTLVNVLGKKLEHTHIVIQEIETDDWGFAGMLTTEWRKKTNKAQTVQRQKSGKTEKQKIRK